MSRKKAAPLPGAALVASILVVVGAPLAADQGKWQVGIELGRSSLERVYGERHVKTFDDRDAAAGVEVGYFFNEFVGIQVGYHDLGSFEGRGSVCPDDVDACIERLADQQLALCAEGESCLEVFAPIEADVTGWSLAVVPRWPLTKGLAAFAKLGALEWESELSSDLVVPGSGRTFESFSGTDLLLGIGLSYRFSGGLGATAEYRRLDGDLAWASLGLDWRF